MRFEHRCPADGLWRDGEARDCHYCHPKAPSQPAPSVDLRELAEDVSKAWDEFRFDITTLEGLSRAILAMTRHLRALGGAGGKEGEAQGQIPAREWTLHWDSTFKTIIAEGPDIYANGPLSGGLRVVESLGEPDPAQDHKALYYDLLFQVEMKVPGETRHETAKRLIRQRGESGQASKVAPQGEEGRGQG